MYAISLHYKPLILILLQQIIKFFQCFASYSMYLYNILINYLYNIKIINLFVQLFDYSVINYFCKVIFNVYKKLINLIKTILCIKLQIKKIISSGYRKTSYNFYLTNRNCCKPITHKINTVKATIKKMKVICSDALTLQNDLKSLK